MVFSGFHHILNIFAVTSWVQWIVQGVYLAIMKKNISIDAFCRVDYNCQNLSTHPISLLLRSSIRSSVGCLKVMELSGIIGQCRAECGLPSKAIRMLAWDLMG